MFLALKNAGIDVSIYGVPKQIPAAIVTSSTFAASPQPQMRAPSPPPSSQMSIVGAGRVMLAPTATTSAGFGPPTYLLLTPTQATAGPGGQVTYSIAALPTAQEHSYATSVRCGLVLLLACENF